ncbi:MAG: TonB-dependent receptor [Gammaproteobacteria bacterium]|nr:TonB-dependent receptor [Gammaproteobacteria bacterium]
MKAKTFGGLGNFLLGTVLLSLFATVSYSQVLEEITVTAQKREQDISDVGISITAYSGQQLRQLGITSTLQLDDMVPGLMVTDFGSGTTTQFTIRGSAQLDFADHQEPPVAVYSDGVYNSYMGGVAFSFFDIDRIEVLRGPQGTLFGRNATGGLVHVISNKPTRENEGFLELTGGEFGQIRGEGAISGPLGDSMSGRLSMAYENTDGYQENRTGPDVNDVDNFSGRVQLLFEPSDDLSVHITGNWGIDDAYGQGYSIRSALNDFAPGAIPGLVGDGLTKFGTTAQQDAFCAAWLGPPFPLAPGATDCFGHTEPDDGDNKIALNDPGFFKRDHYGITGKIEWTVSDGLRIVSITNWQDFEKQYLEDVDGTPAPLFTYEQGVDSNQFSQELQIHGETERLKWVAGAYYLNIDNDILAITGVMNCCLVDFDNNIDLETESYAGFLQAEFALTDQFTFIGGFRWTEDEKDIAAIPLCFNAGPGEAFGLPADPCDFFFGGTAQVSGPLADSRSEGEWSGVFELDWTPSDDLLVYAKYSRGNKAGGFNAGATFLFDAATVFEFGGEVLKSYEGGVKATLFNGRARLNASVFHYDYQDFQNFSAQGINLIVFNTDAENTGAEIELIANPFEGLELLLGLSLQDAKQKDVMFAGATRDMPMPNAPDVTFNGLGRYAWPMLGGSMAAQVDFNYVDRRALNGIDHPALFDGSYVVANARLDYTTSDGRWELGLWLRNFTNEDYVATVFDLSTFTGILIDVPNPPRWFGGTIRYNWGG